MNPFLKQDYNKVRTELANNEKISFTRRIHNNVSLRHQRNVSDMARKMVTAWDEQHNPEEVLRIFKQGQQGICDYHYWEFLRTVWITCGHTKYLKLFYQWFTSKRKEKWCFMTPEEAKRLRELPNPVTCYRAINEGQKNFSWTLNHEYAQWYASQFKKEIIQKMEITKDEIFALIERNGEEEILVLDKTIMDSNDQTIK